ncbi:MAG TPA: hypothetical protein VN682_14655 [Terriglobales bacterium]|nr:hypothetical protein [Terriglobales bacterium]
MRANIPACTIGAVLALTLSMVAQAQTIHPGPVKGAHYSVDDVRGMVWCEIVPVTGTPPNITVQIYNSTGVDNCTEERAAQIDPVKLAVQLGVSKISVNSGYYWVMDKVSAFTAGEIFDFDGIKARWDAQMVPAVGRSQSGKFYEAFKILRDTEWLYRNGSTVWLLRTPDDRAWVLQAFTKAKDPTLSMDTLDTLGEKLKIPDGWKFEKKTLTKDLSIEPRRSSGYAYVIHDDLGNSYQGCGFDNTCNYLP